MTKTYGDKSERQLAPSSTWPGLFVAKIAATTANRTQVQIVQMALPKGEGTFLDAIKESSILCYQGTV